MHEQLFHFTNHPKSYSLSYIQYISTAVPKYCHQQSDFMQFYAHAVDDDDLDAQRKIRIVAARSGIQQRYSVIPDFSLPENQFAFFHPNKKLLPEIGLNKRMDLFKQEAIQLSLQAVKGIPDFENIKQKITHIITVTCTGLYAPGLDIELIQHLQLANTTVRTAINFMGCNAAILALKEADHICKSNANATVLLVATELCTLHFQRKFTDDYIISNHLFADGSAAVIVSNQPQAIHPNFTPLQIDSFLSLIAHEGNQDMAWQVTETGFVMNLSSYVSAIINQHLPSLFTTKQAEDIDKWLIHPGGKKILDECAATFQLSAYDLHESYDTLANYGNMSSPTILFVMKQYAEQAVNRAHQHICAIGFGPGLSIESMKLTHV